jgi:hypothetical protein
MLVDSSGLRIFKYSILAPPTRNQKEIQFFLQREYRADSLICATFKSLAADENGQLWILNQPIGKLKLKEIQKSEFVLCEIAVKRTDYRPIAFSDTLQMIKVKRKLQVIDLGYYVKDADTTFAFKRLGKGKFEAPILKYEHILRFKNEKGKVVSLSPKRIALKYKRRKQRMVGKVKKF